MQLSSRDRRWKRDTLQRFVCLQGNFRLKNKGVDGLLTHPCVPIGHADCNNVVIGQRTGRANPISKA